MAEEDVDEFVAANDGDEDGDVADRQREESEPGVGANPTGDLADVVPPVVARDTDERQIGLGSRSLDVPGSEPLPVEPQPLPERTIEELKAPGVYDLTPVEEQRLRDHFGYAPSDRRTKAERDHVAAKIMSSERVQAEVAWAKEVWARQAAAMGKPRRADPRKTEKARKSPWDG